MPDFQLGLADTSDLFQLEQDHVWNEILHRQVSQLLLLLILLFGFMINRRHMQGSFDIITVKKLLICHCHRHLRRVTCSALQCREQLNSVKSCCDVQRDWDIDCAMCFPCQNGTISPQRIQFFCIAQACNGSHELLQCIAGTLQWIISVTE